MNWQEFLKREAGKHELTQKEEEILLIALPPESEPLSNCQLAKKIFKSEATVKSRMGKIYKKFANSCPGLTNHQGAGKLEILRNHFRQKYNQKNEAPEIYHVRSLPCTNPEFHFLIQQKIENFCGREFLFNELKEFINKNRNGYFIVVGYPGTGKTAIAAKYLADNTSCTVCFFNEPSKHNAIEDFLRSVRRQIIEKYNLDEAENDDLTTLLSKASHQTQGKQPIVIVIDSIDAGNQEEELSPAQNFLNLPQYLPYGVYFLLTRIPYNLNTDRLFIPPETPRYVFNLHDDVKYGNDCKKDVTEYIDLCYKTPELKTKLSQWLVYHKLSFENFKNIMIEKSESNFVYLRYFMKNIFEVNDSKYGNITFHQFPYQLQQYYKNQISLILPQENCCTVSLLVLYLIIWHGHDISLEKFANILKYDEWEIQKKINQWLGVLKEKPFRGETYYQIYHNEFLRFLQSQPQFSRDNTIFSEIKDTVEAYKL